MARGKGKDGKEKGGKGDIPTCSHCGKKGHTIDKCWAKAGGKPVRQVSGEEASQAPTVASSSASTAGPSVSQARRVSAEEYYIGSVAAISEGDEDEVDIEIEVLPSGGQRHPSGLDRFDKSQG